MQWFIQDGIYRQFLLIYWKCNIKVEYCFDILRELYTFWAENVWSLTQNHTWIFFPHSACDCLCQCNSMYGKILTKNLLYLLNSQLLITRWTLNGELSHRSNCVNRCTQLYCEWLKMWIESRWMIQLFEQRWLNAVFLQCFCSKAKVITVSDKNHTIYFKSVH